MGATKYVFGPDVKGTAEPGASPSEKAYHGVYDPELFHDPSGPLISAYTGAGISVLYDRRMAVNRFSDRGIRVCPVLNLVEEIDVYGGVVRSYTHSGVTQIACNHVDGSYWSATAGHITNYIRFQKRDVDGVMVVDGTTAFLNSVVAGHRSAFIEVDVDDGGLLMAFNGIDSGYTRAYTFAKFNADGSFGFASDDAGLGVATNTMYCSRNPVDGSIWAVTSSNTLRKYSAAGVALFNKTVTVTSIPILFAPSGNIVIPTSGVLREYDANGDLVTTYQCPGMPAANNTMGFFGRSDILGSLIVHSRNHEIACYDLAEAKKKLYVRVMTSQGTVTSANLRQVGLTSDGKVFHIGQEMFNTREAPLAAYGTDVSDAWVPENRSFKADDPSIISPTASMTVQHYNQIGVARLQGDSYAFPISTTAHLFNRLVKVSPTGHSFVVLDSEEASLDIFRSVAVDPIDQSIYIGYSAGASFLRKFNSLGQIQWSALSSVVPTSGSTIGVLAVDPGTGNIFCGNTFSTTSTTSRTVTVVNPDGTLSSFLNIGGPLTAIAMDLDRDCVYYLLLPGNTSAVTVLRKEVLSTRALIFSRTKTDLGLPTGVVSGLKGAAIHKPTGDIALFHYTNKSDGNGSQGWLDLWDPTLTILRWSLRIPNNASNGAIVSWVTGENLGYDVARDLFVFLTRQAMHFINASGVIVKSLGTGYDNDGSAVWSNRYGDALGILQAADAEQVTMFPPHTLSVEGVLATSALAKWQWDP